METLWCPLCDWSRQSVVAQFKESNGQGAPGVALALGMPTAALAYIHENQMRQQDEDVLQDHYESHSIVQWAVALQRALTQVQTYREMLGVTA